MVTIGWLMARTQPRTLIELSRRKLLSVPTICELAGLSVSDDGEHSARRVVTQLMSHDAHRRVRGRLVQIRRGA